MFASQWDDSQRLCHDPGISLNRESDLEHLIEAKIEISEREPVLMLVRRLPPPQVDSSQAIAVGRVGHGTLFEFFRTKLLNQRTATNLGQR